MEFLKNYYWYIMMAHTAVEAGTGIIVILRPKLMAAALADWVGSDKAAKSLSVRSPVVREAVRFFGGAILALGLASFFLARHSPSEPAVAAVTAGFSVYHWLAMGLLARHGLGPSVAGIPIHAAFAVAFSVYGFGF